MSTRVPLTYCDIRVGYGRIDDWIELDDTIVWRLLIPVKIRETCKRSKEMIAATLHDAPEYTSRCTPFCWVDRFRVELVHAVLSEELRDVVNGKTTATKAELRRLTKSVGLVGFKDEDRTNCQRENLRVFSLEEI